jgi:hypothetical protein
MNEQVEKYLETIANSDVTTPTGAGDAAAGEKSLDFWKVFGKLFSAIGIILDASELPGTFNDEKEYNPYLPDSVKNARGADAVNYQIAADETSLGLGCIPVGGLVLAPLSAYAFERIGESSDGLPDGESTIEKMIDSDRRLQRTNLDGPSIDNDFYNMHSS